MKEREIFDAALLVEDAASRTAYVRQACGDNDPLREHIEGLLRAEQMLGSFLQVSPAAVAMGDSPTIDQSATERPGTVIGPYKLLQVIGEGGMGVVYMAEQTEPVARRVALKIIKPGMDSRQVIARFEAERQALAMMDHPNIARVLDAGATTSGLPYFVMELVHGVPITKYCDDTLLTPRERLELFVPVCQAIQHAHQKGIIHRDIKPSNVMVTLYDGKPMPKVIDFGVAKATEQRLTERTLFTQCGTLVGTLEYMSPEQAEQNALGVDTRSDIYSLGVLLYELLTGTTPLTHERLEEAAFAEILRLIKEEEPAKPSTRLTTLGDALPSISALRKTEPANLAKLVRGELDWIVMKTLEKDRNRRYETANGLVRDIDRYLHDEPVQACPPSALYRFRKFARRNKRAVAVASTAMGSAVAALVLTVVLLAIHSVRIQEEQDRTDKEYQRAEIALQEAKGNLQRADQNLGLALQALDDLCMKDVENRIVRDQRMTEAERESLQRGLAFYERFAEQNSGHAELQGVMAKAYRRAGFLRLDLKDWQAARASFSKAIPVFEKLADDSADSAPYRRELARCCFGLSLGLVKDDRYREAEPICRRAISLLEKLTAEFPHEPNYRKELGYCLWQLGGGNGHGILLSTSRPEEAEKTAREALRLFEALAADFPKERFYRQETAFSHAGLSNIFKTTGRLQQAVASRQQAIGLYTDLVVEVPNDSFYRRELAHNYMSLGYVLQANQQIPEAEEAFRQAVAGYARLVAESHQAHDRWELGFGYERLGLLQKQAGQFDEAAKPLRAALVVWDSLVTEFNKADYRQRWSATHRVLAELLFDRARAVEKDTKLSLAERQAAAQAYREDAKRLVREGNIDKGFPVSWFNLADYPEAESILMESLAGQIKKLGADHLEISLEVSFAMHQLALNYLESEKYAEAEMLFRACLPVREKEQPESWMTFNTKTRLGAALLGQQKYAEAEPFLLQGYEGLKQHEAEIPAPEKYCPAIAVNWLGELYDAWGQKDKADKWRQRSLPTPTDNQAGP